MRHIIFSEMSESDFLCFIENVIKMFAEELFQAKNFKIYEDAFHYSNELVNKKLLYLGQDTPGHEIYRVMDVKQKRHIGSAWYTGNYINAAQETVGRICYIEIFNAFRGQGFGSKLINEIECRLKQVGLHAVTLNVFETNKLAKSLYDKLGYTVLSVNTGKYEMQKMFAK